MLAVIISPSEASEIKKEMLKAAPESACVAGCTKGLKGPKKLKVLTCALVCSIPAAGEGSDKLPPKKEDDK